VFKSALATERTTLASLNAVADSRRLAAAAVGKVRYIEEEGLMHVYPLIPFFPEARRAWAEIERFVDGVLAPRQAN
jgi:acetyl esterase/lipase